MQIVFLGTGAFIETPNDRTLNTIYMSKDGKGILLNCTKDIVTQLSKNNISISDINSIIIPDSNIDGLVYVDKMLSEPMNVYVNKTLLSKQSKFVHILLKELKVDMITNITTFKVTKLNNGVLIDDVLYANSVTKLVTKLNSKIYSKANTLIINANSNFYDTFNFIENALNITNKYLPNTVILNNIDTSYPTYEHLLKPINLYWDRIKVSDKVNVKLSYDSMVYDTVDLGYQPGIYLNNKIIDSILSGKKEVLSRVTCLKDLLGKELLLLSDKQTVGTIIFDRPTKCNSSALHNLSNYSKIIHDYSTVDVPLLLHTFKFTKFKEPKLVVYNHKSYFQEYIPNVCVTEHLIKDINLYDKTTKSSDTLLNDHRLTHMYYSMSLDGTKIKHSREDLINLHNLISTELLERNLKHDIINDLDKFELSDTEQMCDLVHDFTDRVLIKDVVSLLNSDDGLLQFAFKDFKESFEQSLSTSLSSQFDEKLNIELLSSSDNILKDIEIPIYDLVLLKRSPRVVKLKKSKFETFEPFIAPESKNIKDIETLITELW